MVPPRFFWNKDLADALFSGCVIRDLMQVNVGLRVGYRAPTSFELLFERPRKIEIDSPVVFLLTPWPHHDVDG